MLDNEYCDIFSNSETISLEEFVGALCHFSNLNNIYNNHIYNLLYFSYLEYYG